jgi:hypothetical protein
MTEEEMLRHHERIKYVIEKIWDEYGLDMQQRMDICTEMLYKIASQNNLKDNEFAMACITMAKYYPEYLENPEYLHKKNRDLF